ncbi:MAG: zinc-ribbon domain containing protein [Bacillota bacterium]|nr:zinc-ribbon domain containing protein [Bacillota bacterium]NLU55150.1 zinc-binding protein [Bacillota bacterium]HOA90820.1 zinc-ribbon domain containing protein [Bacillota bacterium]HOL14384.1 zinc-ribbon domain containing protein [Bacillota bacterium]HOP54423.1 zinc-ribbon domain containing protein [Bacillota bacterium]
MYQDETLVCRDCGSEFVFTAGEKEFYATKGFENKPARCPECRKTYKAQRSNGGVGRGERKLYEAVCADCGVETKVPFKPNGTRPVYCSNCYEAHR